MSIPRTRPRNDASNGDPANGVRVSPDRPSTPVLDTRKHPPLVQHVNNCPECLLWVLDYMDNIVRTTERKFR